MRGQNRHVKAEDTLDIQTPTQAARYTSYFLLQGKCAEAVPPAVIESFLAVSVAGLQQGQPVPMQVGTCHGGNL